MAIQDEMYIAIEQEIDKTIAEGREKVIVKYDRAKEVAKMLTELSTDKRDADTLTNQYIARIRNICNS